MESFESFYVSNQEVKAMNKEKKTSKGPKGTPKDKMEPSQDSRSYVIYSLWIPDHVHLYDPFDSCYNWSIC